MLDFKSYGRVVKNNSYIKLGQKRRNFQPNGNEMAAQLIAVVMDKQFYVDE